MSGLGKDIKPPIVFQGGVAFNKGIVKAFQEELKTTLTVPEHHEVMGAIGAALLVHEAMTQHRDSSKFKGFGVSDIDYRTTSFECKSCSNLCEIAQLSVESKVLARWGGRCDLWERSPEN